PLPVGEGLQQQPLTPRNFLLVSLKFTGWDGCVPGFMLKSTMQTLKMRRVLFCVILSWLFVLPLRAQQRFDHITFGAGAGFTFPLDALSHHTKTGFNFVASGGPRFDRLSLTLDFSLHYLNVKNSLESKDNLKVSLGSMMRLWTLTVNPR